MRPAWAGNPNLVAAKAQDELNVKVRIVPAGIGYDIQLKMQNGGTTLLLAGNLNEDAEPTFVQYQERVTIAKPTRVVIEADDLDDISKKCARALAFFGQRLDLDEDIYLVGPNEKVKQMLTGVRLLEEMTVVATPPARAKIYRNTPQLQRPPTVLHIVNAVPFVAV